MALTTPTEVALAGALGLPATVWRALAAADHRDGDASEIPLDDLRALIGRSLATRHRPRPHLTPAGRAFVVLVRDMATTVPEESRP